MKDILSQQIATENLALWQQSATENRELRLLQAAQHGAQCATAWKAGTLRDETALVLPPATSEQSPLVSPPDRFAHLLAIEEQLAFCAAFIAITPFPLCEEKTVLPPPPAAPRVAFCDSHFARVALHSLSRVLPHARPLTAHSFLATCEALADDRADFALLPIEDSTEGALTHVLEEIDRMELHVTHTCDVPYPDEGRSVTMALLTHRYTPKDTKGKHRVSLRVLQEDAHTLPDLCEAAACCGFTLHRIISRQAPYGDSGVILVPTFETDAGDVSLFEAYLAAKHPRAEITGRYVHITS